MKADKSARHPENYLPPDSAYSVGASFETTHGRLPDPTDFSPLQTEVGAEGLQLELWGQTVHATLWWSQPFPEHSDAMETWSRLRDILKSTDRPNSEG